MLRVSGLSVSVRGKPLLHVDALSLQAGEFCAVIGPNGAGKSTLLQAIAGGVLRDHAGEISLRGMSLARWRTDALALQRSWLPQRVDLAWAYRVREVIELACWQYAKPVRQEVLKAIRSEWGLEAWWERPCAALSGGEQRRVHLARAAAQVWAPLQRHEPVLLLLDEPVAHLDPAAEQWALQKLCALAGQGAAILCVLHDINLAARHATQLLALRNGQVLAQGRPHEVLAASLLSALYDVPFTGLAGEDGLPWFVPQAGRSGKTATQ